MAEDRLREDEVAYFLELIGNGVYPFLNSSAQDTAMVILHRLLWAGLNPEDISKILAHPAEIVRLVRDYCPAPAEEFAHEEVESTAGYPAGFPDDFVALQRRRWARIFPRFDDSYVSSLAHGLLTPDGRPPSWSEAIGVIPKPSRLGGDEPALERVVAILIQEHGLRNWLEGCIGSQYHRLVPTTAAWYARLEQTQPGDYLVFPFQFGRRHLGRSIRRARACFAKNEVGLDAYAVGSLLVVHPDRLNQASDDDIWGIDCPGSAYRLVLSDAFSHSLRFVWLGGRLNFDLHRVHVSDKYYGSPSALVV